MINFRAPGVFIEEHSFFPASVKAVETAIPAFISYTEKGPSGPTRIASMNEYRFRFSGPANELPGFSINSLGNVAVDSDIPATPFYKMYYQLQMYFANGGGPCYIISAGTYSSNVFSVSTTDFMKSLELLKQEEEPALIVLFDAPSLSDTAHYHDVLKAALMHCSKVDNRFLICDVLPADNPGPSPVEAAAGVFRNAMGVNNLIHGAAYYPSLQTSLKYQYEKDKITVSNNGTTMVLRHSDATIADDPDKKEESLFHANDGADSTNYQKIIDTIEAVDLQLPPSGAIAGVYASVDRSRGVWKAPANVSLNLVKKPTVSVNHNEQKRLNVSPSGQSINAIREFSGRGVLVWGARTLAGNDNEWRYISVRRFFNMVESSVKKASRPFVFEPNDANTWMRVKVMVENFLSRLWRDGALAGAKEDEAYFVKIGLGETMTQYDIQNGKLIIEIGMAVVRPAEFNILRIVHHMAES